MENARSCRWILFWMLLCFVPVVVGFEGRDEGMKPARGFFLPEGNSQAGKKAFSDLRCNACHWVANDLELGVPVTEKTGPMLGEQQGRYSPGWIANSIVSPSHTIALDSEGQASGSELSRMGDFTETMTVRQLIDLTAYIRSLDEKGQQ